jgi:hypothetical protein
MMNSEYNIKSVTMSIHSFNCNVKPNTVIMHPNDYLRLNDEAENVFFNNGIPRKISTCDIMQTYDIEEGSYKVCYMESFNKINER